MNRKERRLLRRMFLDWWDGSLWAYDQAWGSTAERLAREIPAHAEEYAKTFNLRLHPDMRRAVKKGSL